MEICFLEISQLNFTGNIIPHCWYSKVKLANSKPDLLGITLLAEIVYWYRPRIIKDESTGGVLGYKKRFSADMLQRSLASFEKQFGESKRKVAEALKRLEKAGLIIKDLRTVDTAMGRIGNVMYLAPVVSAIKALESDIMLIDDSEDSGEDDYFVPVSKGSQKQNDPSTLERIPSYKNTYEGIPQVVEGDTQKRSTYTKNTTKTTTKKKAAAKGSTIPSNKIVSKKHITPAAVFSGESKYHSSNLDNELGEKLTPYQIDRVKQLAEVVSTSLQRSPDQIYQEIEYVLLCKSSFTHAGNDFTKKLNTIISVVKKGQWTVPAAVKDDKVKRSRAKIDPVLVEKNDAESEISHWSRMLNHAKRMNCSQTIKNCEGAIEVAKQKLKMCIESYEKIQQEEATVLGGC